VKFFKICFRPLLFLFLFLLLSVAEAQTNKPAGPGDYRTFALRFEGDAEAGRKLFLNEQLTACSRCHSTDAKGGKAGPGLSAIGDKFGRREIIDAILNPSKEIAVGYSTIILETASGEEVQGILKNANDQALDLVLSDSRPVHIPLSEITSRRTSDISLMPEGLFAGLTLEQFNNLVEYLVTLKQPESAELTRYGMPREISELPIPIEFEALHLPELKFDHPVWCGAVPGETNTYLVVEHETGTVWRLDLNNTHSKTVFAEFGRVQQGTRGLIGLALHPNFRENRKYYFAQHQVDNGHFATHVFEVEASADLKRDSGRAPRLVIKMDATSNVHYGGGMLFGPDGLFYIGMGDTGPQEDPQGNGQNPSVLLGKILRIDVNSCDEGRLYSIPGDNPFRKLAGFRPEIWALGFREPWRFSFDPLTGDLWVGDVGQDRYEEVSIVRAGENHGWNVYEGFERFSNKYRKEGATYTPPIFAYTRKYGVSVTGGFVYRAQKDSSFYGVYIFGDYESKRIWGLTEKGRKLQTIRQIGTAPQRPVSFTCTPTGELLLIGYEGTIYKMVMGHSLFK
jgi:putative heme-binding domain-containing protein